ncbi:L antigen family member 3-like isoform X1 [Chiloscyllium plagiosum]|uniref:L antigen family member 3-like isoform X1 n=1 Tax=Chiloscyllium plagiosum TaxID=36176 RepID=UPI001CB80915|nr:L antigen family member 3-like isoform X1 [Chiloscyllium plagiosum]
MAADPAVANGGNRLRFHLRVPFPSALEARIALGSLQPDREPRKGGIERRLSVQGRELRVPSRRSVSRSKFWNFEAITRNERQWEADEARILRVSISSFLDHLALVLLTMERFGPPRDPAGEAELTGAVSPASAP